MQYFWKKSPPPPEGRTKSYADLQRQILELTAQAEVLRKKELAEFAGKFPEEFEIGTYRLIHEDLADLHDEQLRAHYSAHGASEGRRANRLKDRQDFAALARLGGRVLEIGPFANPILSPGGNIEYADWLDQSALVARAISLGIDASRVPYIKHVLSKKPLSQIDDDYNSIISSHNIEHQPDLIGHLLDVEKLLRARGGVYFILAPDKRYCFDRDVPLTTVAELVEAHELKASRHSLRNIIYHRAYTTHNDAYLHWAERGLMRNCQPRPDAVKAAVEEWRQARGQYIDVHAWYFTPDHFVSLMEAIKNLGYISMSVERIYPTRKGSAEFWAIMAPS